MPSQTKTAGAVSSSNVEGGVAWSNTSAASVAGGDFASVELLAGESSEWLMASAFDFTIPRGSTIDGITAEYETSATLTASARAAGVRLTVAGMLRGISRALSIVHWLLAWTYVTAGTQNDRWEESFKGRDVNASDFGIAIRVTNDGVLPTDAHIRHIRMTIHYTLPIQTGYTTGTAVVGA